MSLTIQDCDCALRSFWDGPCEYHTSHPLNDVDLEKKFSDYGAACQIELNKAIDPIVEQCAKELGWKAGHTIVDVDKEFHIHPMSFASASPEAWKFVEEAHEENETVTGMFKD